MISWWNASQISDCLSLLCGVNHSLTYDFPVHPCHWLTSYLLCDFHQNNFVSTCTCVLATLSLCHQQPWTAAPWILLFSFLSAPSVLHLRSWADQCRDGGAKVQRSSSCIILKMRYKNHYHKEMTLIPCRCHSPNVISLRALNILCQPFFPSFLGWQSKEDSGT